MNPPEPSRAQDHWPASRGRGESPDPRSEKDFDPSFYPLADGVPAPAVESTDRHDQIKREFCAVYYQLNRFHARLTDLRKADGAVDPSRERELMQEIEEHLRVRDELEDRYAPFGVIAEAVAAEGFTRDIRFTFGDRTVFRQESMRLISSTALLIFEEPDEPSASKGERAGEGGGEPE